MIFIMIVFVYNFRATEPVMIHSIEFNSRDKCIKAGEVLKKSMEETSKDAYGSTCEKIIYNCVAK